MIESREEIVNLLKEYQKADHEHEYQICTSYKERDGEKRDNYSFGVVYGKFSEKDPDTQAVIEQGVTDNALYFEIELNQRIRIKRLKDSQRKNIMHKRKLESLQRSLNELSKDNLESWIRNEYTLAVDILKIDSYSVLKMFAFLSCAFENYKYSEDNKYCSDVDKLITEYSGVMGKNSQLKKYGIIPVDSQRELLLIRPPRIYDKAINKTFFTKNVSLHFLEQIQVMINNNMIKDFAVRLENESGYQGKLTSQIFTESFELGMPFDFVNLGKSFVSKLYSEIYMDCLWVVIDSGNITFEELCEDEEMYSGMKVTQVVHLEHFSENGTFYISHLDHEYIFYSDDEYHKRLENPDQKGEASKRMKSFKIDNSKIPFDYQCEVHVKDITGEESKIEHEQFLYFVLDCYFKHKDLLKEYFGKISL